MPGKSIVKITGALAFAAVLGVGGYGLYRHGINRGIAMSGTTPASSSGAEATLSGSSEILRAGDVDPATDRRVLYWHDPMFPGQRFDQPGRSPFMNMPLVPVYEGDADGGSVSVSPRVQQNLGVRTAQVVSRTLTPRVEAVGNIAFNERDQVIVQARATAYVERLHVRATLDYVEKGQALADLYVPEWVAAQEEFLSVQRLRGGDFAELIDAARQRLRQAGMNDEQIRAVEDAGAVQARIALAAPIAGIVTELAVREGMTVMPGTTLYRINGLSTVWAIVAVPESQAATLRSGASAELRSPALPGTLFSGTVQAILPEVDPATRTIGARIELTNPGRALTPGMFVNVALGGGATESLTVPSEAVITTGTRTVVILADGNGTFHPAEVEVGIEAGGDTEIRRGLAAGQTIVVSGQFLIDSEASLQATGIRMEDMPAPQLTEHVGEGTITAVGPDSVTLSHGPIPSMEWDSMSMEFMLPSGERRIDLQAGQAVRFAFTMAEDGKPHLTRIEPQEGPQ